MIIGKFLLCPNILIYWPYHGEGTSWSGENDTPKGGLKYITRLSDKSYRIRGSTLSKFPRVSLSCEETWDSWENRNTRAAVASFLDSVDDVRAEHVKAIRRGVAARLCWLAVMEPVFVSRQPSAGLFPGAAASGSDGVPVNNGRANHEIFRLLLAKSCKQGGWDSWEVGNELDTFRQLAPKSDKVLTWVCIKDMQVHRDSG